MEACNHCIMHVGEGGGTCLFSLSVFFFSACGADIHDGGENGSVAGTLQAGG